MRCGKESLGVTMTPKSKRRLGRWLTVLSRDDGYTFGLNMTFLVVTFGIVILAMLMWYASGLAAHEMLLSAAKSAAVAGQAQVSQATSGSGTGFSISTNWAQSSSYQAQAEATFQQQVADMNLDSSFSDLQCTTSATSSGISVSISGEFLPVFLQKVAQKFPQIETLSVPMHVTVDEQYTVVGD